ncbi:hypothetical protein KP509_13G067500 [Ceratopteris richardii]|uniref:Uncharacterized protein n=1 Tax=Ceratopteris richardii TaxID=49495 RepID=A0A8T2TLY5_CERRI|nr:hypothetical protein KP509_13G067500 [Ceratopteris richardii]
MYYEVALPCGLSFAELPNAIRVFVPYRLPNMFSYLSMALNNSHQNWCRRTSFSVYSSLVNIAMISALFHDLNVLLVTSTGSEFGMWKAKTYISALMLQT